MDTTNRSKTQYRRTEVQNLSEYGKIPPQAIEFEEAVLGAIMLEREAMDTVQHRLTPETFYKPAHQAIYRAITALYKRNDPIDILTVTTELRKNDILESVGGAFYITQLTSRIASSANIDYHVAIMVQKYMQRLGIIACNNTTNSLYQEDCDAFEALELADKNISQILEQAGNGSSMEKIDIPLIKSYEEAKKREISAIDGKATGINTGLKDLNKITGGWQNSDLIILAARPGMGKTALMLKFGTEAAKSGVSVCTYSLEMSSVHLVDRLVPAVCDIDIVHYKNGHMEAKDWNEFNEAFNIISKLPIYVDPKPSVSMSYIKSQSRIMKKKGQCGMVLIDYLQLVDTSSGKMNRNREQEVAEASRSAKIIAKELDIPVILLCQLSRKVEDRKDNKPMLSDLRESGAIEQDADLVIFIYRPEYYGYEENSRGESLIGIGDLFIEKHRNGPTGTVKFRYNNSLTKITDYEMQECMSF